MAKLAIDRASIVFGKKKSGDFHSKSGDFHNIIKNQEISRKSGDLEALHVGPSDNIIIIITRPYDIY